MIVPGIRNHPAGQLRFALLLVICGLAAALLAGCGNDSGSQPAVTGSLPKDGDLLFVTRGEAKVADGSITIETEAVEWFTDRPKRRAGVADSEELVERWKDFGFDQIPPNAAVTGGDTDAVVELSDPQAESGAVSFAFSTIRGELDPADGEDVSVFIDNAYTTTMHGYGAGNWCQDIGATQTFHDPKVIDAPDIWLTPPLDNVTIPTRGSAHLFTAASKSGTTSATVQYDIICTDTDTGELSGGGTFVVTGTVPSSLFQKNTASCSINVPLTATCTTDIAMGFHGVDLTVELYPPD